VCKESDESVCGVWCLIESAARVVGVLRGLLRASILHPMINSGLVGEISRGEKMLYAGTDPEWYELRSCTPSNICVFNQPAFWVCL